MLLGQQWVCIYKYIIEKLTGRRAEKSRRVDLDAGAEKSRWVDFDAGPEKSRWVDLTARAN